MIAKYFTHKNFRIYTTSYIGLCGEEASVPYMGQIAVNDARITLQLICRNMR